MVAMTKKMKNVLRTWQREENKGLGEAWRFGQVAYKNEPPIVDRLTPTEASGLKSLLTHMERYLSGNLSGRRAEDTTLLRGDDGTNAPALGERQIRWLLWWCNNNGGDGAFAILEQVI